MLILKMGMRRQEMGISKEKAINYLKEIKEVFDKNEIPFWLEDGTLLGAYRDKCILPWDNDVDLGLFEDSVKDEDAKKRLTRDFIKKGFYIYFFDNMVNINKKNFNMDILLVRFSKDRKYTIRRVRASRNFAGSILVKMKKLFVSSYYGGINLNFSDGARILSKTNLFNITSHLPNKLKDKIYKAVNLIFFPFSKAYIYSLKSPAKHFLKLKTINFYGEEFKIPSFTGEYLKIKYGNWKTPPKDPSKWRPFVEGEWVKSQEKNT